MTRLLLDTHVLLDIASEGRAPLPADTRDESAHLLASVASLWEIVIKYRLGKLELSAKPEHLPKMWEAARIEVLDVTRIHVLARGMPDPETRDPFDRLLLAICSVEKARLVTRDAKLIDHPLSYRAS